MATRPTPHPVPTAPVDPCHRPVRRRASEAFAALSRHGFSRAQALECGASDKQLARWLRDGELRKVRQGVYQLTSEAAHQGDDANQQPVGQHRIDAIARVLARAGQLRVPAVIAHRSAGILHGLRLPYLTHFDDERLYVLRSPDDASVEKCAELVVLPAGCPPRDVVTLHGIPVTSLERTAVDLMRGETLERALVVADHAIALGADLGLMDDIRRTMSGWPGSRVLRPALIFADPLAESGLESMARGVALASGLPAPELQVAAVGATGANYRLDMFWAGPPLALEIDGQDKYAAGPQVLLAEKAREHDLRKAGIRVERMVYDDLHDPARAVWKLVAEALRVPLLPYDRDWMQTPRWERRRRRA